MKVLDLRCANGHGFEGWFGSEEDFLAQHGASRIACPVCADSVVTRLLSAPRLNLSGARAPADAAAGAAAATPAPAQTSTAVAAAPGDLQALWLQAVRHVIARTEDVGERFPEEARRMHYGEVPHRAIRGAASPEEREALHDEGIEVIALPVPLALKGPLQ